MSDVPAAAKPTKFGMVLFDGFELLDVFGPLDTLFMLSKEAPIELHVIAQSMDPVTSKIKSHPLAIGTQTVPTTTFDTAPDDLDVLIVPGGRGTRELEETQCIVDFVSKTFPKLKYLLTVCTGSAVVARTGILDGKNATTNKRSWDWATSQGPKVNWVHQARWVVDGNIYTSSGISAGIDMFFAFVQDVYGKELADQCALAQEYIRNTDPDNDPFARKS
ncbi:hypothetical protein Golomagni_07549 [Golovinomyces magnicellulatus]|nr:hypothetical protein Golomagni_07549 [Golovinomyces magnicellulatus]